MAHSTFNGPLNLTRLTLASHNFIRSPTISPLLPSGDAFQSKLRSHSGDNDDFQSNASNARLAMSHSGSPFSSLEITYPQVSEIYTKAGSQKLEAAPPDAYCIHSQRQTIKTELGDPVMGLQGELSCFYEPQIAPSWSFSDTAHSNYTLGSDDPSSVKSRRNNNMTPISSFSSIASASGISVDYLAEQLAATANLALQYMENASSGAPHLQASDGSLLEELYDEGHTSWPPISTGKSDMPIDSVTPWMVPSLGVDPSELTSERPVERDSPINNLVSHTYPYLEMVLQTSNSVFELYPEPVYDHAEAILGKCGFAGDLEGAAGYGVFPSLKKEDGDDSDFRLSESDTEDNNRSSSSFPSPCRKIRSQKRLARHSRASKPTRPASKASKRKIEIFTDAHVQPTPVQVLVEGAASEIDLGTPVLNAHLGITVDTLVAKAEHYRLRNPDSVYDNSWLASFAGKLTSEGELTDDYRCYVEGCTQINKRRDHILIHVGSHLDQRPYVCAYCPSRFLRKNECKRHEVGHSGVKPYPCTICPSTAFVRQDLLKRHIARKHGIKTTRKRKNNAVKEESKENHSSKRMKMEHEGVM